MSDLFSDFDAVSAKAWKQKIQFDLKGADYNDTLVWESLEGIKVKPFYTAEDRAKIAMPPALGNDWRIGQAIYAANEKAANAKALDALQRGATSISFTIPSEEVAFPSLIQEIAIETTPIYLEFEFLSKSYIQKILETVGENIRNLYLNIDCIGHLARSGNWYHSMEEDHQIVDPIVSKTGSVCVDMTLYQNAGANMVQQLAYGMAHANEYLNRYAATSKNGFRIIFKVSVGTHYFFEIAKLKALRVLCNTLATAYDSDITCHIITVPTRRNKTIYDYNVNMLRTVTESMAAVLGGSDTVINARYDHIYHKDNEFGERIARNQLLLLKEESYFGSDTDPVAGTYFIENTMEQLCEKALDLFKHIENGGGFLKQLKNHTIQRKIKESAQKEQQLFDAGSLVLTGTNTYQNSAERMKGELEHYPFVKRNARKTSIAPIIAKRLAESLEQQRLREESDTISGVSNHGNGK